VRFEIVESEIFALCVAQNGGAKQIDEALAAIINALHMNPFGFSPTGVKDIGIAKTRIVIRQNEVFPALSVRFRVSGHTVFSIWR
jgi:hypothetical protein